MCFYRNPLHADNPCFQNLSFIHLTSLSLLLFKLMPTLPTPLI